jgi:hypothetical protein
MIHLTELPIYLIFGILFGLFLAIIGDRLHGLWNGINFRRKIIGISFGVGVVTVIISHLLLTFFTATFLVYSYSEFVGQGIFYHTIPATASDIRWGEVNVEIWDRLASQPFFGARCYSKSVEICSVASTILTYEFMPEELDTSITKPLIAGYLSACVFFLTLVFLGRKKRLI